MVGPLRRVHHEGYPENRPEKQCDRAAEDPGLARRVRLRPRADVRGRAVRAGAELRGVPVQRGLALVSGGRRLGVTCVEPRLLGRGKGGRDGRCHYDGRLGGRDWQPILNVLVVCV